MESGDSWKSCPGFALMEGVTGSAPGSSSPDRLAGVAEEEHMGLPRAWLQVKVERSSESDQYLKEVTKMELQRGVPNS